MVFGLDVRTVVLAKAVSRALRCCFVISRLQYGLDVVALNLPQPALSEDDDPTYLRRAQA